MKSLTKMIFLALGLAILFWGAPDVRASEGKATEKRKSVIASVNGEAITQDDLDEALAPAKAAKEKSVNKPVSEVLGRLINSALVVQEGKKIGLHELPEIKSQVEVFSKATLRDLVRERQMKQVKADPKTVEMVYRNLVREWKISALRFDRDADAQAALPALRDAKDFDKTAQEMIKAGKAKEGTRGQYFKAKDLNPEIAMVVSKLQPKAVSPAIPVGKEYTVIRLDDVRYPDNREAKAQARQDALDRKKAEAFNAYLDHLLKKYTKVRKAVLQSLDYEAVKPGFESYLKDKRAVADIAGESPITVGDLTMQIQQQLFHGVKQALDTKKLNVRKEPTLHDILSRRVMGREARRLGIDKTEQYKKMVRNYENSLIFGAFVQKAVAPDVKLSEEEVKAYYDKHLKDFTFPEMMRISSIAFAKRSDGEEAMEKLRKGVDIQWVMENAEGQVPKGSKGLLVFDRKLVMTSDFPEGLKKVVSGAKSGDFRLYAGPESYVTVLAIQEVVPAKSKAYEETREEIAKKIFEEKISRALGEWIEKLRAASDVKVFLSESK